MARRGRGGYRRTYRRTYAKGRRGGNRPSGAYSYNKWRWMPRKNYAPKANWTDAVVADKQYLRFKWEVFKTGSTNAFGFSGQTFRGNSLYDPDSIAGALQTQPQGFDEWFHFYNYYRVFSSKIKVTFTCGNGLGATPLYGCLVPICNIEDLGYLSWTQAVENTYARTTLANPGGEAAYLTHYFTTAKAFGVDPMAVKTNGSFSGVIGSTLQGSNPEEPWFWGLYFIKPDGSPTSNIYYRVQMTFYAELWDRKRLAVSLLDAVHEAPGDDGWVGPAPAVPEGAHIQEPGSMPPAPPAPAPMETSVLSTDEGKGKEKEKEIEVRELLKAKLAKMKGKAESSTTVRPKAIAKKKLFD